MNCKPSRDCVWAVHVAQMNVLNECSGASKCEALENSSLQRLWESMWDTGVKVFFGVGNGSGRGTSFGPNYIYLTPLAPNYIYSFDALSTTCSGDLSFSQQDGIYGFKFPETFLEISPAISFLLYWLFCKESILKAQPLEPMPIPFAFTWLNASKAVTHSCSYQTQLFA